MAAPAASCADMATVQHLCALLNTLGQGIGGIAVHPATVSTGQGEHDRCHAAVSRVAAVHAAEEETGVTASSDLGTLLLAENFAEVVTAPGGLDVATPGQHSLLWLGTGSTVRAAWLFAGVVIGTLRPQPPTLLPALVLRVARVPGVTGQLADVATL